MPLAFSVMKLMEDNKDIRGVNRITDDRPRSMTRYVGGHSRTIHPYVSGYWYSLIRLPVRIFGDNKESGELWLHSSVETFNPPSKTSTKVDLPGLGGLGSSFIAGQQFTRTFSMEFREFQDTPISSIFERWVSIIDPHYGVSELNGDEYIPANYKGSAMVFLCKPTVSDISSAIQPSIDESDVERFYYFEGVFPEGMPDDAFSSDISTNDVSRINISFSFDGWPIGKEHRDIFRMALEKFNGANNHFGNHHRYHVTQDVIQMPENSVRMTSDANY